MLSVSLLGDFGIRYDQTPVLDVDTPRLQSLLAFLILHRGAPQSRAHLAFQFWPDTTEAQARTNLRNLLHHLRRALPDADSYLDTSVQALQWRCDAPSVLDVACFEEALSRAGQATKAGDAAEVQEALEQATAVYMGDLLPSCYDDWIVPHRERLHQAHLGALERLTHILEEQRDYEAAIHYAQRLLRDDPLHEAGYRRLIRLHAVNGDRADALRVYHSCATVLQRELGVEPSAATREAYEHLLSAEARATPALLTTTAYSPLVGREAEWTQMQRAWRTVAVGGEPHALMLCGEAGIGKTRLVEELLQWATRQGLVYASARCYAAEGELAYAPVITWLRAHPMAPLEDASLAEVARLLPEVLTRRPDLPQPAALTEAWQRERLFEALSRATLGMNQPLLLTIDDLQWCDRDTLEWLHFLLRFDRRARLLVIGTYRPEEIEEGHPLCSSLQALRLAEQVTEVELRPLDEADTRTLATHVAGKDIGTGTARLLYQETEGNPLFVVETMRAGLPVGNLKPDAGMAGKLPRDDLPGNAGLPVKVQAVLEARLAQLTPQTRELAGLAATIGRGFGYPLLAKASGLDEECLVRQIDELWLRRIVREHGTDAYDFSHDKLREVAYYGLSTARRRLLHRRVGRALEALHAVDLGPVSHQVAAHYERAGLPEQAAPYYLRAAKVARQVYANEEAIALLRRGLALVADQDSSRVNDQPGYEVAARLYEELGDILALTAQHGGALEAFRNARARVPGRDRIREARLHRKAGAALHEQRLYREALAACRRAEAALGEPPAGDAGAWWDEWLEVQVERVWAHYWLAEWPEMEELLGKAHPFVRERGGAANRTQFLMASCLMHLRRYRYTVSDEMLADSREAHALSLELSDLKSRTDCRFELGFLHLWRRDLDEAEEHLRVALELAETYGYAPLRTLALTYLTVLCRFRGQLDGVSDYVLRAREAAETAHMPDYVAAANGNQAWLAWRRRDLPAVAYWGEEALAAWRRSPMVYPFQWQALWPLAAAGVEQGQEEAAWAYAEALLEPTQQRLPDALDAALKAAVQAKAHDQAEEAEFRLDQSMALAREMGYL